MLVIAVIFGILVSLIFPAIGSLMESAQLKRAKNDAQQIASAVKQYQTVYGKLPTSVISYDDGPEAAQGWFQENNDEIVRLLAGENFNDLNPRKIVLLEARPAKGGDKPKDGVGADGKFYDPWGGLYAIKLDTSYNNALEYYGVNYENNCRTTVIAVSFGKNKIQQDPGKSSDKGERVDDVVSFQ